MAYYVGGTTRFGQLYNEIEVSKELRNKPFLIMSKPGRYTKGSKASLSGTDLKTKCWKGQSPSSTAA